MMNCAKAIASIHRLTSHLALAWGLSALMAPPSQATGLQTPPTNDLLLSYGKGMLTEVYQPEETSVQVPWTDGFQFRGSLALSQWDRLWLRLGYSGYQFEDPDFPGTTHRRAESRATVGYMLQTRLLDSECGLGLGYGYQHIDVTHSAKFPYSEPSFLFTPWLDQHGPTLIGRFRRPLFGPVWLAFDCEGQSYANLTAADSRLAMPPLLSLWASPGLTVWDQHVSLFYVYERTSGTGYTRESHGAVLSLSLQGW